MFTSRFFQTLQDALGTKLRMSSSYHLQTDGQLERMVQSLKDLLRTSMMDHLGVWDEMLHLVEFTYNNIKPILVWHRMKFSMPRRVELLFVGIIMER